MGRCAKLQYYHNRFMSEGTLSVFSESVSILIFGQTICSEHYAKPTPTWCRSMATLSYKEHEVDMGKVYAMVRQLTEIIVHSTTDYSSLGPRLIDMSPPNRMP